MSGMNLGFLNNPETFLSASDVIGNSIDKVVMTPVRIEEASHGNLVYPGKHSDPSNIYGRQLSLDLSLIFLSVAAGLFYIALNEYKNRQEKNQSSLPFLFLQIARLVAEQKAIRDYYETINTEDIDNKKQEKKAAIKERYKNFHARKQLAAFKTEAKKSLKKNPAASADFIQKHCGSLLIHHTLVKDDKAKSGYKWEAINDEQDKNALAAAPQNEKDNSRLGRLSRWFDKMENKTWVTRGLAPAWKATMTYSILFWIAWFFYWIAVGATPVGPLANALVFIVPLIPILGYAAAKSIETRQLQKAKKLKKVDDTSKPKEKSPSSKKTGPSSENKLAKLHRKLFAQLVHREYNETLKVKKNATERFLKKLFGPNSPERFKKHETEPSEEINQGLNQSAGSLPPEAQYLIKGYKSRMAMAAISGFFEGFVYLFLVSWLPGALLGNFTTRAGLSLAKAVGSMAFLEGAFAFCVVAGIFYAAKGLASSHKEYKVYEARIKENKGALEHYQQLKVQNVFLKSTLEKNSGEVLNFIQQKKDWTIEQKENAQSLLKQQNLLSASGASHTFISNPTTWERFKAGTVKVLEPILLTLTQFGTGFLTIRNFLYLSTSILSITVGAGTPAGWAIIGISLVTGLAWAGLSLYQHYQAEKNKKAQALVDNIDEHVDLLEKEQVELKDQLTHLNAFQKTVQEKHTRKTAAEKTTQLRADLEKNNPRAENEKLLTWQQNKTKEQTLQRRPPSHSFRQPHLQQLLAWYQTASHT